MAPPLRKAAPLTRRANFDRVARSYRLLEHLTLGRALTRARTTHLPALAHARSALILGDGDGRALAALLHLNSHLDALAIDSSRAMLHLLTRRCAFASSRLSTLHADALPVLASLEKPSSRPNTQQGGAAAERRPHLSPPLATDDCSQPASALYHRRFDLVTTHFFLDCFSASDLARLIPAVRARLDPGALWVVSDFRIPPSGPTRLPARILVRLLYLAFRLLTGLQPTHLPEYAPLLRQSGLVPVSIRHSLAGLLTAELWQLGPAGHTAPTDSR